MEKKHDKTWDKLEEAITLHESSYSPDLPKSRKVSAGSCRKTSHSVRSKSTCKESSKLSRPQTSSIYRSFFSTSSESLPYSDMQQIYSSKCKDLEIPVIPDQERRFFSYCSAHFTKRLFCLRENGLGLRRHSGPDVNSGLDRTPLE